MQYFFWSCALVASLLATQARAAYYYVKIERPSNGSFTVQTETGSLFKLSLKQPSSDVTFALDLAEPGFFTLRYGQQEARLFGAQSDDLKIFFDANDMLNTLRFEGKGANENNFLANFSRFYGNSSMEAYGGSLLPVAVAAADAQDARALGAPDYFSNLGRRHQQQLDYLQSEDAALRLHPKVRHYVAKTIQYNYETAKLAYVLLNKNRLSPMDYPQLADKYKLAQGVAPNDADALDVPAFLNYVNAYVQYNYAPVSLDKDDIEFDFYKIISDNLGGRTKSHALSQLLIKTYYEKPKSALAQRNFKHFAQANPFGEYTDKVLEVYGPALSFEPEVAAPNFSARNEQGELVSLNDYRGKVVYISFWASWCGPCLRNFQKSEELRERLESLGVVLLNVSLDDKESVWRATLAKQHLVGTNLLANNADDIKRLFDIASLPLYHIINKQGKFAYLSQEGTRDIYKEFEALVK
jgi:peroxiredoxin